jgi:hypothetical protein
MQREILEFRTGGKVLLASRDVGGNFGGFMFDDPFEPSRLVRVEFPLSDDMKSDRQAFGAFLWEFIGDIRDLVRTLIEQMPGDARRQWDARRISKAIAEQVTLNGFAGVKLSVAPSVAPVDVPEVRLIGYMIHEATRTATAREHRHANLFGPDTPFFEPMPDAR